VSAVEGLRQLAGSHSAAVGEGIPALLYALRADARNVDGTEVIQNILEILRTLVAPPSAATTAAAAADGGGGMGLGMVGHADAMGAVAAMVVGSANAAPPTTPGGRPAAEQHLHATELILSDPAQVELLLEMLEVPDPWVRLPTIQLLSALLHNDQEMLMASLLACAAGMDRVLAVLEDRSPAAEMLRNELLLLLKRLTEDSIEVQNFIAFSEGFDKLFAIMEDDGRDHGGGHAGGPGGASAVTLDCLRIVHNVLGAGDAGPNDLAQKLFVQGEGALRLASVLAVSSAPAAGEAAAAAAAAAPVQELTEAKRACLAGALQAVEQLILPGGLSDAAAFAVTGGVSPVAANRRSSVAAGGIEAELRQRREASCVGFCDQLVQAGRGRNNGGGGGGVGGGDGGLLGAIARLALLPTLEPRLVELAAMEGGDACLPLQLQALGVLRVLACNSKEARTQLAQLEVQLPPDDLADAAAHGAVSPTQPALTMLLQLDLAIDASAEREAAGLALDQILGCTGGSSSSGGGGAGGGGGDVAKVTLVGHAAAPPPSPDQFDAHDAYSMPPPPVGAGRWMVEQMATCTSSVLGLDAGEAETFAGRAQLAVQWRATLRFADVLHGSAAAKELALRVAAPEEYGSGGGGGGGGGGGLLFGKCVRWLSSAVRERAQLPSVQISLFRLLLEWVSGCPAAARELVNSPASLFLFDLAKGIVPVAAQATPPGVFDVAPHTRSIAALLLGCCLEQLALGEQQGGGGGGTDAGGGDGGSEMDAARLLKMLGSAIGIEAFTDSLELLGRQQLFKDARARGGGRALRYAKPLSASDDGMLALLPGHFYDAQFCALVTELTRTVQGRVVTMYTSGGVVSGGGGGGGGGGGAGGVGAAAGMEGEQVASMQAAYQDIIRVQDRDAVALRAELEKLQGVKEGLAALEAAQADAKAAAAAQKVAEKAAAERAEEAERLRARLKDAEEGAIAAAHASASNAEVAALQAEVDRLLQQTAMLEADLVGKDAEAEAARARLEVHQAVAGDAQAAEARLTAEVAALRAGEEGEGGGTAAAAAESAAVSARNYASLQEQLRARDAEVDELRKALREAERRDLASSGAAAGAGATPPAAAAAAAAAGGEGGAAAAAAAEAATVALAAAEAKTREATANAAIAQQELETAAAQAAARGADLEAVRTELAALRETAEADSAARLQAEGAAHAAAEAKDGALRREVEEKEAARATAAKEAAELRQQVRCGRMPQRACTLAFVFADSAHQAQLTNAFPIARVLLTSCHLPPSSSSTAHSAARWSRRAQGCQRNCRRRRRRPRRRSPRTPLCGSSGPSSKRASGRR
jgi:hypothetical protein